jgi:hypothetical protein
MMRGQPSKGCEWLVWVKATVPTCDSCITKLLPVIQHSILQFTEERTP